MTKSLLRPDGVGQPRSPNLDADDQATHVASTDAEAFWTLRAMCFLRTPGPFAFCESVHRDRRTGSTYITDLAPFIGHCEPRNSNEHLRDSSREVDSSIRLRYQCARCGRCRTSSFLTASSICQRRSMDQDCSSLK